MILPILLCSNTDDDQAVALLDFIALMRNKMPYGHLLIACHACHAETQLLLKISAQIGFASVEVFAVPQFEPPPPTKAQSVNLFYQRVLGHCLRNYKGPFLMLEPDVVPTCPEWLENLEEAYAVSPKLYLGSVLADAKGSKCMGRVGIYPRGAAVDIGTLFTGATLFEIAAGENLVSRCEKTRLIQVVPIITSDDLPKVRPDAVIVHGDKAGFLLAKLREEWEKRSTKAIWDSPMIEAPRISCGLVLPPINLETNGHPPLSQSDRTLHDPAPHQNGWQVPIASGNPPQEYVHREIPKLDARTRAGRAARAHLKAQIKP